MLIRITIDYCLISDREELERNEDCKIKDKILSILSQLEEMAKECAESEFSLKRGHFVKTVSELHSHSQGGVYNVIQDELLLTR